jgi:tetratricopeptide (TPR) repeat protein
MTAIRKCVLGAALTLSAASPLGAVGQEPHHHEEEQLGTVSFPTSCAPPVQKAFERGVALLHSFWYEEAEKQFVAVIAQAPDCAMAHWGVAMSLYHQLWERPDAADLKRGWEEMQKAQALPVKSAREGEYVAALAAYYRDSDRKDHQARATAYADGMEKTYRDNPADHEAAAFYALSLLGSEPPNDTTFANRKQAIPILNELFAKDPDQPGVAHYLIHSCDKPQLASMGLAAARRYARIAPSSPHALHMPSHIFIRLGLWHEAIESNLASIAATRKTAAMHMGGEGHQFHAMDFLQYAYMQTGDDVRAKALLDEVNGMAPMDHAMAGMDMLAFGRSQFAARYALERHQWAEAARLEPVATKDLEAPLITLYARAIGAARSGDAAAAAKAIGRFNAQVEQVRKGPHAYVVAHMDVSDDTMKAWLAFSQKRNDDALRLMHGAAERQDARGLDEVEAPAREMLADMLLEMNRPEEALTEYEAMLKEAPGRFNALYGAAHSAELASHPEKAGRYYAALLEGCGGGAQSDRPELARARALVAAR